MCVCVCVCGHVLFWWLPGGRWPLAVVKIYLHLPVRHVCHLQFIFTYPVHTALGLVNEDEVSSRSQAAATETAQQPPARPLASSQLAAS